MTASWKQWGWPMGSRRIDSFAQILSRMELPEEQLGETRALLADDSALTRALDNPVIPVREKDRVVDRCFPAGMAPFIKTVIRHGELAHIGEIMDAASELSEARRGIVRAQLSCAHAPRTSETDKIKMFISRKYRAASVLLSQIPDDSLLDGFTLRVGDDFYDWSLAGRLRRLEQTLTGR